MAPKPLLNPGVIEFRAVILKGEHSACRFVEFPFDVEKLFGRKGNVEAVRCTFNGAPEKGPLYRRSRGLCHILLLRKALREKIGVGPGDEVAVTVRLAKRPPVTVRPAAAPVAATTTTTARPSKRAATTTAGPSKPAATTTARPSKRATPRAAAAKL